jgi:transposase
MTQIARKTKRYPSDLTDDEWDRIAPLMPAPGRRGRPREVDFREVINAVRYLVRSSCGWWMLSIHFGPWQTVYGWFRELARRFLFQTIHDVAPMVDRERAGREASPSAAVIGTIGNSVLGWVIVMRKELHDGTTQRPCYSRRAFGAVAGWR